MQSVFGKLLLGAAVALVGTTSNTARAQVTAHGPWTWVPMMNNVCRHGTPTGIGVRVGTDPSKLVITLQGGGACFNGASCAVNLGDYDKKQFDDEVAAGGLDHGIWDGDVANNAVAGYTHVFIPYCTGDLFAGAAFAHVSGVGSADTRQYFVGYNNLGNDFDYIVRNLLPTGDHPEVHLEGDSAGGFGALLNAARLKALLPPGMSMSVLADSAPPFMSDMARPCMQGRWAAQWGFANSVLPDCPSCTSDNWLNPVFDQLLHDDPDVAVGLLSSTADVVLPFFSSVFQTDSCAFLPSATQYRLALEALRSQMHAVRGAQGNVATYLVPSIQHVYIINEKPYFDTNVNWTYLHDWFASQYGSTGSPYQPPTYSDVGP